MRLGPACHRQREDRVGADSGLIWLVLSSDIDFVDPAWMASSICGFPVGVAVITRWRIRGEGGISGLGGCKIGSRRGLVQAGNAGPRSP